MKNTRHHRYSFSEVLRAACLAVTGSSATEIADALGQGANTSRVFRILRMHGIRLVPKTHAQIAFPFVVSREAMDELERIVEPLGLDARCIAPRVFEEVARDSANLREIVKRVAER